MDVDWHVERLGAGEQRFVGRMIEVTALRGSLDERALEAEVAHRALQFIRRRVGIGRGQVREPRVAGRVRGHLVGEQIVGLPGPARGRARRQEVGARAGEGEHLHGLPRGVERLQAAVGVGQLV